MQQHFLSFLSFYFVIITILFFIYHCVAKNSEMGLRQVVQKVLCCVKSAFKYEVNKGIKK